MKQFISIILICVFIFSCACFAEADARAVSIVATIYPEYDWVKQIVGDAANAELTLLLDDGVDLHSFQPTVDDMIRISECDLFIYVGGESDEWVEPVLANAANPDMRVIDLLELPATNAFEEETLEGMESEEEEEEGEEEGVEYDEHVWLSLKRAQTICGAITDTLCDIDPQNADSYRKNTADYIAKLAELDGKYTDAVKNAARGTLLFGDRFPFRYMAEDYGLECYAAFSGCSAETEASFETIAFLSEKVVELELPAIITIEGSDQRIAEAIARNTGSEDIEILVMDSMQSTTSADAEAGASYLSIMEKNLETLERALK